MNFHSFIYSFRALYVNWYSDSDVDQADEGITCLSLVMRDRNAEWAWFNQCDVTLSDNVLVAQLIIVCLFVLHITTCLLYTSPSPRD